MYTFLQYSTFSPSSTSLVTLLMKKAGDKKEGLGYSVGDPAISAARATLMETIHHGESHAPEVCLCLFVVVGVCWFEGGFILIRISVNFTAIVFFRVSAHARISAHAPFLAFLAMLGGTHVSAHPSLFDLEARVDIRASTHPVLLHVRVHV